MRKLIILLAALIVAAEGAVAGRIYQCEDANGHITFSQTKCPDRGVFLGADAPAVDSVGESGLRQGEKEMLQRSDARDEAAKKRSLKAQERIESNAKWHQLRNRVNR